MQDNKTILQTANAAILRGANEGFLFYCTEDTQWNFVGEQILNGKEAVRQWMAVAYKEPPKFNVKKLVAEDDTVVALGRIYVKDDNDKEVEYSYCDVWQFREGKMASLQAFVIKP